MHESSIEIGALDNKSKVIPLVLGPLLALALYFILPETYISAKGDVTQLSHAARACVSMVLWMAIWWFTEAVADCVLPAFGCCNAGSDAQGILQRYDLSLLGRLLDRCRYRSLGS